MASAAGRDITAVRLRLPGVTTVAGSMRVKACRNRKRDAAPRRAMTGRAGKGAHFHVTRVIELHIETSEARERFQSSRIHIGVTNGANWSI